jgi:hypothetical protein
MDPGVTTSRNFAERYQTRMRPIVLIHDVLEQTSERDSSLFKSLSDFTRTDSDSRNHHQTRDLGQTAAIAWLLGDNGNVAQKLQRTTGNFLGEAKASRPLQLLGTMTKAGQGHEWAISLP